MISKSCTLKFFLDRIQIEVEVGHKITIPHCGIFANMDAYHSSLNAQRRHIPYRNVVLEADKPYNDDVRCCQLQWAYDDRLHDDGLASSTMVQTILWHGYRSNHLFGFIGL